MNNVVLISLIVMLLGPQQTPRGSIEGVVLKAGTADGVARARVQLTRVDSRAEPRTAAVTAEGRFLFGNLEPGRYQLAATRNGYVSTRYGQRSMTVPTGLDITVAPGQDVRGIVLHMIPAGTITGRIYDQDGEPFAGVMVQAFKFRYQEGRRTIVPAQQARTNDLGEYRLYWLNPGVYYVSAAPESGRPDPTSGVTEQRAAGGYIPIYHPGTADMGAAAPIDLRPGMEIGGIDLTVSEIRTFSIRGFVINARTGQPERAAAINLVPDSGIHIGAGTRIDGQGRFEIRGVVPGTYELVATIVSSNERRAARVPLEVVNADLENIALVLASGVTINGRVFIEGAAGPTTTSPRGLSASLWPETRMRRMAGGPSDAPVGNDGIFQIREVTQGDYALRILGMPSNWYVKAARMGAVDVLNQGLRVEGDPSGLLEILLSPNTGNVSGTLQDEKDNPSPNSIVVLVPEPARRHRLELYKMIMTGASGRFRFDGIPPGNYKAFAWEDIELGAWQDPEFIRLYENRGIPVYIPENGQLNIRLRAIPSGV